MFRFEVISELSALERISSEWRELYERSRSSFVMSPTWQTAWWRTMGDCLVEPFGKRQILAVVVRDEGGRLVGLALLCRRWASVAGVPRVRLDALGTGEPKADEVCTDYFTFLASPEHREAIADTFVSTLADPAVGRWDDLELPVMRRDDPMVDALGKAFVARGFDVRFEPLGASRVAKLERTFDAYLAKLPQRHRYAIRRAVSDFETWAGPAGFRFERVRTEAELEAGVETLVRLHGARWGESNIFNSERFRRFHALVMRNMVAGIDARLDLWVLSAHGRDVAALYNIAAHGSVAHYQAGRAVDLPKGVKPGLVANIYAMKRAIDEGMSEYDFLPGDSQYKQQLSNQERRLTTLRVTQTDVRAVGLDFLSSVLKRAARVVRAANRGHALAVAVDSAPDSAPSSGVVDPRSNRTRG